MTFTPVDPEIEASAAMLSLHAETLRLARRHDDPAAVYDQFVKTLTYLYDRTELARLVTAAMIRLADQEDHPS